MPLRDSNPAPGSLRLAAIRRPFSKQINPRLSGLASTKATDVTDPLRGARYLRTREANRGLMKFLPLLQMSAIRLSLHASKRLREE